MSILQRYRNLTFFYLFVIIGAIQRGDFEMKKDVWKKRVALVALTGLLSGIVLCQKQEFKIVGIGNKNKKELDIDMEESQNDKTYFVPDYALLEYERFGEKQAKVVEVSKIDENTVFCQSITTPDLVATITKNGDEITYSMGSTTYPFKEFQATNIHLDTHLYSYVQQYCEPEDSLYISKETMQKIEDDYGKERVISSVLAENANGEWKVYKDFHSVSIQNENGEINYLLMASEQEDKNYGLYRSLTNPEVYLEVIYNEDCTITYLLKTDAMLESQNEDFSNTNKVIGEATIIGLNQMSYGEALQFEGQTMEAEQSSELTR